VVNTNHQSRGELSLEQAEAMARRHRRFSAADQFLWDALDQVLDPELPALSIWELGVLQDVRRVGEDVVVTLTPTYAGCPAMATIRDDVIHTLQAVGIRDVVIENRLQPVWTTDWLDRSARNKLQHAGIAPPNTDVCCPQCGSKQVSSISAFGSTACKALYRCVDCLEVFDRFKVF
jgi:ring-1,2-phenylacetyl-CoA epoxidase subunit PaaD